MSRIWRNPSNLTGLSFILLALAGGFAAAALVRGGSFLFILISVGFLLMAIASFTKAFVEAQRAVERQRALVFVKARQAAERN
jgi:hypothetical protein